jgi:hypothetical protein
MKVNKWTVALAATGVVGYAAQAEEKSSPVNTLLPSTTLSGYVDTSANWDIGNNKTQATRFANTAADRQGGFNVNAVKIALEKPLEEGVWAAGYKVESVFGSDAAALPGRFSSTDSTVAGALKQAYVALRAPVGNGLDFKIGQFYPIIGYEVFDSYANPNFSRSFGFALEPLSHTGVLATYQFSDTVGFAGGIADTHFGGLNTKTVNRTIKTYMGGLTLKAPESLGWLAGSSLYAGVVYGADSAATAATGATVTNPIETTKRPVNLYAGASLSSPWKAITWGLSYDYLFNPYNTDFSRTGFPSGVPRSKLSSYADAAAVYVSWQVQEKLKLNFRGEYATSSGGVFIPSTPSNPSNDEKLVGGTVTADYSLWANVITRLEVRWDHIAGGTYTTPFNNNRNDITVAANVIYKF